MQELRDKWSFWPQLAWGIAIITGITSIALVLKLGFVDLGYGKTEPNYLVWAVAIGQTVGAVLLAVMFSMLNSIYKTATDVRLQNQRALKRR